MSRRSGQMPMTMAPYMVSGRMSVLAARRFPWLYLVTDPRRPKPTETTTTPPRFPTRQHFLDHIEGALRGGVDIVQFRDKTPPSDADFVETASALADLTRRYDVPLIINDRVDVAVELGCWVHVGRKDWPAAKLAELRGRYDPIVQRSEWQVLDAIDDVDEQDVAVRKENTRPGVRLNTLPSAAQARMRSTDVVIGFSVDSDNVDVDAPYPEDADYLGVGPIFATKTKKDAALPMGIAGLKRAMRNNVRDTPVVAIGGINAENVDKVMECGCAGVAVIGEIMDASDPTAAAAKLKKSLRRAASHYRFSGRM